MIRLYTANFEISPMDMTANFNKALEALQKASAQNCNVVVFPRQFLVGAQLGVLKNAFWFYNSYNNYITEICKQARAYDITVISDNLSEVGFVGIMDTGENMVISDFTTIDNVKIYVASDPTCLFSSLNELSTEYHLIVCNWSVPTVAGQPLLWQAALEDAAQKYNTTFALCTGGMGFSTHPDYFAPLKGVITPLQRDVALLYRDFPKVSDVIEVSGTEKTAVSTSEDYSAMTQFPLVYSANPLIPANVSAKAYALQLFDMQSVSLANRLKNIGCKDIVLNLSGGLDSTLALLVCVNTFDLLGLDKKGLHIVTMPGFGTSETTKNLALQLCESLHLPLATVDIKPTCAQALQSIHHDGTTADVVFENVQARVRTVNGLNLANAFNGLMIGTGDLSEEALGFSTYGGDQLASYNVNCCVSKTVIRTMLGYITDTPLFFAAKETVQEILAIPVSPELIPHGGEILQKTEEILAPYALIDFFIYCLVIPKLSPKETIEKALATFGQEFSPAYLQEKLNMFYRKFAVGQFKRSCAPECAKLTHVALLGENTAFPSDGSTNFFTNYYK